MIFIDSGELAASAVSHQCGCSQYWSPHGYHFDGVCPDGCATDRWIDLVRLSLATQWPTLAMHEGHCYRRPKICPQVLSPNRAVEDIVLHELRKCGSYLAMDTDNGARS